VIQREARIIASSRVADPRRCVIASALQITIKSRSAAPKQQNRIAVKNFFLLLFQ